MSSLLSGLISYYALEGDGTDSTGLNDCTSTSITYSLANGIIGQGAGFPFKASSGINIRKLSPTGLPTGFSSRTLSYWLKTTQTDVMVFVGYGTDAGTPNQDFVGLLIAGKAGIGCGDGGLFALSTSTANDGNWHHIVGTYNGSTLRIYFDGVLESTATGTLNTIIANLDFNRYQMSDSIDEVGFWFRVLTLSEITELYNSGAGLTYPFVAPPTETPSFLLNVI